MREFESGATRDTDEGKPDYEAYLSPLVIERFGQYMLSHQNTPLGKREGDNWQKGFGLPVIMKSLWRHFFDVWKAHRGHTGVDQQEALCAVIFNAQAYLHALLEPNVNRLGLQPTRRPTPTEGHRAIPNTEPCETPSSARLYHKDGTYEDLSPLNKEAQRVQGEPDPAWEGTWPEAKPHYDSRQG